MIKNVNTIEDYRNLDKNAILAQAGRTVRGKSRWSYLPFLNADKHLDLGCHQRWHYLLVSFPLGLLRRHLFCRFKKVQVHLYLWLPSLALRGSMAYYIQDADNFRD